MRPRDAKRTHPVCPWCCSEHWVLAASLSQTRCSTTYQAFLDWPVPPPCWCLGTQAVRRDGSQEKGSMTLHLVSIRILHFPKFKVALLVFTFCLSTHLSYHHSWVINAFFHFYMIYNVRKSFWNWEIWTVTVHY